MENERPLSVQLAMALELATQTSIAIIEGLPLDETAIIPQLLLFKDAKLTVSAVVYDTTAEAVEAARRIIRAKSSDIDAYTLSYCAVRIEGSGKKYNAMVIEAGEQGEPFHYTFYRPFERTTEGKVILLTEKPVLQARGAQLL